MRRKQTSTFILDEDDECVYSLSFERLYLISRISLWIMCVFFFLLILLVKHWYVNFLLCLLKCGRWRPPWVAIGSFPNAIQCPCLSHVGTRWVKSSLGDWSPNILDALVCVWNIRNVKKLWNKDENRKARWWWCTIYYNIYLLLSVIFILGKQLEKM
jgi:hypothetical protein